MCNYFSCIATRKGKIIWDKNKTAHEELIKKAGLKDDKLEDRDFVRLEMTPNKRGLFTQKKSDWNYKVDEQGTLPNWYVKNEEKIRKEIWKECQKSFKKYKTNLKEVSDFILSLKKIKWFSFSGKIDSDWHMNYGANIAAARDAARAAARDAAWAAAGDAARAAAGDAAGDAALYAQCLLVKNKIAKKHMKHAEKRMEVWKRGYGLRFDVNGKLYVYAVKKAGDKE